ncbi:MAG: L,D-transpeptidase family protein [Moraxella sp.]|nr:L,D-transpeptidase family protein [Moraxella sp.]
MNTQLLKMRALLAGCLLWVLGMAGCYSPEMTESAQASEEPHTNVSTQLPPEPPVMEVKRRPNVSQQFVGIDLVSVRLASALDELPYETQTLDDYAKTVNVASWSPPAQGQAPDTAVVLRIQALLNWHHHAVGAVDGKMSKNTIKAMNVFQETKGLTITDTMDLPTWQALLADDELASQPVLVHYTLTAEDVRIYGGRSSYRSVSEAVAEKFHMSQSLLKSLNPNTPLKAGNTITVYNPYQPNEIAVAKVKIKRKENILYAYDKDDKLVASYPTTINQARTPKGTYKVTSRVIDPSYNKDFRNKKGVIAPGPNNPVGRVWIGISKPSFGIHGSPEPEKISRQTSAGCVRLTNWDALGLFGAIEHEAVVEFI